MVTFDAGYDGTTNCEACGLECVSSDLRTVKLAGFIKSLSVCKKCASRTADVSLKDAAELLKEIVSISSCDASDPELRLKKIKLLIG